MYILLFCIWQCIRRKKALKAHCDSVECICPIVQCVLLLLCPGQEFIYLKHLVMLIIPKTTTLSEPFIICPCRARIYFTHSVKKVPLVQIEIPFLFPIVRQREKVLLSI